ncbi:MAG: hypothetical protein KJ626_02985 [Verrucomicrobia bacterium]|nr:hypothetical protein [Verrucomicrobiota bacterium]
MSQSRVLYNMASDYGGGVVIDLNGGLDTCLIAGNTAQGNGGGLAGGGNISYSTVAGNQSGDYGGGFYVEGGNVYASIIYSNTAATDGDNWYDDYESASFEYACTTPDPGGASNITDNPLFVNAGGGDYRLQQSSRCIDAGNPEEIEPWYDLTGMVRPLDGDTNGVPAADLGAYEFLHPKGDSDGDSMFDRWELDHGLNPLDETDSYANSDGDPHDNKSEHIADTDPWDPLSYFHILAVTGTPVQVHFESSSNRLYTLYVSSNRLNVAWTNVPGQGPRDGVAGPDVMPHSTGQTSGYYRVKVQLP